MTVNLEALETSFDLVAPRGDELMDVFYARLFAPAPAVKPLFAGMDLKKQKTMLLGTLVLLRSRSATSTRSGPSSAIWVPVTKRVALRRLGVATET